MKFRVRKGPLLEGDRTVLEKGSPLYPAALLRIDSPPNELFVIGDPSALREGLAVVGARRATPYGISCARRFAGLAASRGITIISGGARGCDAAAHRAALEAGCPTVVFLGGGCDQLYPSEHHGLFQQVVDAGGAVVSEHPWGFPPQPYTFRLRNRLIAGLARATLIVEAGLPSGTFSTADEALAANRDVLVVPGAITSPSSHGANRLIVQGAVPIIDDESFSDALFTLFGCLKQETMGEDGMMSGTGDGAVSVSQAVGTGSSDASSSHDSLLQALRAEPLGMEALRDVAMKCCPGDDPWSWLMIRLVELERSGLIARYPDGRYGPFAKH